MSDYKEKYDLNVISNGKISNDLMSNAISWYPFKKDANVLDIDSDNIQVIESIVKNNKNVDIICNSKEKSYALNENLKSYSNYEIKVGNYNVIELNKKYDYITVIGTLNKQNDNMNAKEKINNIIKYSLPKLAKSGKILLCVDNTFGMKYFTSLKADDNLLCNLSTTISKSNLDKIFSNFNLKYKYYYMLPDFHYANVIFTDNYLPNGDNILRNYTFPVNDYVSYSETEAFEKVISEDKKKFPFFANVFFVEISKDEFKDNEIRFVSYTNSRKDKYKIITTIYNDRVEKISKNKNSNEHIETMKKNIDLMNKLNINTLDSYDGDKIISKYVSNAKSYDEILLENVKNSLGSNIKDEIVSYTESIKSKFKRVYPEKTVFDNYNISYDKNIISDLYFIKDGLWDLTFQNCFYIDNKLFFYDQEWYEENIPFEFILYRNIVYFPELERYIKSDKLFKILSIDKYVDLFKELDNKLQSEIRDDDSWNYHMDLKTGQLLINRYKDLINERDSIRELEQRRVKDYEELAKKYNELVSEHMKLYNKYTEVSSTKAWQTIEKFMKKKGNE